MRAAVALRLEQNLKFVSLSKFNSPHDFEEMPELDEDTLTEGSA
jgi:hypothetical protein